MIGELESGLHKKIAKDAKKISSTNLKPKVKTLLSILEEDPFQKTPPFEALVGDLSGAFSGRINIQHRLVYEVLENEKIVKIISMWTHYEKSHNKLLNAIRQNPRVRLADARFLAQRVIFIYLKTSFSTL